MRGVWRRLEMIPTWLKLVVVLVFSVVMGSAYAALWYGKLGVKGYGFIVFISAFVIIVVLCIERLRELQGKFGSWGEFGAKMDRMEQLQQAVEESAGDVRDIGTKLAVLLAGEIMRQNRFVGGDHVTERMKRLESVIESLKATGAEEEIIKVEEDAMGFFVFDLKHYVVDVALKSLHAVDVKINNVEFHDRFLESYKLDQGAEGIRAFLRENGVTDMQEIDDAIARLESLLRDGAFHSADGELVYRFETVDLVRFQAD